MIEPAEMGGRSQDDLNKLIPQFNAFIKSLDDGLGAGGPACIHPTFFQKPGIAAQRALAEYKNETIGVGLGGSASVGALFLGFTVSFSRELVVSPNGEAALVNTYAIPVPPANGVQNSKAAGASAYGGVQFSFSNAKTPQDLAGLFINIGAGGGDGFGGGADSAFGIGTSNQGIVQTTGTLGGGLGAGVGATVTFSTVTPICNH